MIVFFSYIGYNAYLHFSNDIDTEYAEISTAYDTVITDCFVIRDENRKDGKKNTAIVKNNGVGVYVPYVVDGYRVGSGETIALFFTSDADAKAYKEKNALNESLSYYEKLETQSVLSSFDIDKLQNTVNKELDEYIISIENNNFSKCKELSSSLDYDISSVQIALGEKINFSEKIKDLKAQLKNLTGNGLDYKTISADYPGYFISDVDGYEEACDYNNCTNLTVSEVNKLLEKEPNSVNDNTIGKIVSDFNWYVVCNIPKNSSENLSIGSTIKVSFENTEVTDFSMTIVNISSIENGKCAIVLKSNEMNPSIAVLRKEKIRIKVNQYKGLKIQKKALRELTFTETDEKGNKTEKNCLGVYIKYGQMVSKRKVEILYYDEDYVIVKYDNNSQGYVKLHDMIITKGKNLYDGKIIG